MNTELKLKRKRYYLKNTVLYEILNATKNREVILMDKKDNHKIIRCLNPYTKDFLVKIFKDFDFFDRNLNIYVSVAKYKYIPMFTYNFSKRSKFTSDWFHNTAKNELFDYDLFLDFDLDKAKTIKRLKNDLYKLLSFFDLENIRYNFYSSGTGFQVNVSTNLKPNFETLDFKILTKSIKERFNLKSLCLLGVGSMQKIRKCEYSLVDDRVVFPLHSKELVKVYTPKKMDCNHILKNANLYNRGLKYINNNPLGKKFIIDYDLKFY